MVTHLEDTCCYDALNKSFDSKTMWWKSHDSMCSKSIHPCLCVHLCFLSPLFDVLFMFENSEDRGKVVCARLTEQEYQILPNIWIPWIKYRKFSSIVTVHRNGWPTKSVLEARKLLFEKTTTTVQMSTKYKLLLQSKEKRNTASVHKSIIPSVKNMVVVSWCGPSLIKHWQLNYHIDLRFVLSWTYLSF